MKQLTLREIMKLINDLTDKGMNMSEIAELPIYLGRDDELNGIHTGWYINYIDAENPDDAFFFELIEEDSTNVKGNDKAILIS